MLPDRPLPDYISILQSSTSPLCVLHGCAAVRLKCNSSEGHPWACSKPLPQLQPKGDLFKNKKKKNTTSINTHQSTSWAVPQQTPSNNARPDDRVVRNKDVKGPSWAGSRPGKHLRVVSLCRTGLCCRINTVLPLCSYLCPLSDNVGKHQATIQLRFCDIWPFGGHNMRHSWFQGGGG